MRWITFLILVFFMLPLQMAHVGALPSGPRGDVFSPAIEFLPLLAIFYALFAGEAQAPLAALVCGAAYDMGNKDYVGTNMIPLALACLALVQVRTALFRERALTHALTTLFVLLIFAVLATVFRRVLGAPLAGLSMEAHGKYLAVNAAYTAAWAPGAFWLLLRLEKLLGFPGRGGRRI
jgi:rod shape-determining protein MreD